MRYEILSPIHFLSREYVFITNLVLFYGGFIPGVEKNLCFLLTFVLVLF